MTTSRGRRVTFRSMIVSRRGYTLVEVLVALLLLDVGLLALVGTAASVVRLVGDATLAGRAAAGVESRREVLWSEHCRVPAKRSAYDGPVEVTWEANGTGPFVTLTVTATRNTPRGARSDTVVAQCAP